MGKENTGRRHSDTQNFYSEGSWRQLTSSGAVLRWAARSKRAASSAVSTKKVCLLSGLSTNICSPLCSRSTFCSTRQAGQSDVSNKGKRAV
jgi:hypothetical protein